MKTLKQSAVGALLALLLTASCTATRVGEAERSVDTKFLEGNSAAYRIPGSRLVALLRVFGTWVGSWSLWQASDGHVYVGINSNSPFSNPIRAVLGEHIGDFDWQEGSDEEQVCLGEAPDGDDDWSCTYQVATLAERSAVFPARFHRWHCPITSITSGSSVLRHCLESAWLPPAVQLKCTAPRDDGSLFRLDAKCYCHFEPTSDSYYLECTRDTDGS